MEKEWYVVNTYSGHENKVKEKLEMRASTMGMEDYIFRVVVPEQTEVEYKDGEKKEKVKKEKTGDSKFAKLMEKVLPVLKELVNNKLNVTIGSSLDLFGGTLKWTEVMKRL